MAVSSRPIPNLIQGVSQQAAMQRRDTQCETQFDCINSPKDGAWSRNGAEVFKIYKGLDLTGAFTHEIRRGTEHYLLALKGGNLRAFDLNTGLPCTVNLSGSAAAYLANTSTHPIDADAFRVQTIDDFTFIAKRDTPPGFDGTLAPSRPPEALIFVKAGAYLCQFSIAVRHAGSFYKYTYSTPDNSVSTNAEFIMTSQIAATFYRAMTGAEATSTTGVGAEFGGDTGGSGSGRQSSVGNIGGHLSDAGFSVAINGNLLRIWRPNDNDDFVVDTADGIGDTSLVSFKDTVDAFSNLPKGGFAGFRLRVKGAASNTTNASTDYFVQYTQDSSSDGFWGEVAAAGTKTHLDPATMPHAIVSAAPGVFNVMPNVWSDRIAGDGVDTAKDPGFIGRGIEDLFYHQGRLGFLTESTIDWSKARNEFTHFPDTCQTVLDDAPVNVRLAGTENVALLRRAVQISKTLNIWAQRSQFQPGAVANNPFKQATVEAPPTTAYEFSETANFVAVASSLYFATDVDANATVRSLSFSNGQPIGDTDVTAHVPNMVPAGVRIMAPSDTGQLIFVGTDGDPTKLYLYNYLVQGQTVVQSAWNIWRLPGNVVWHSVTETILNIGLQRGPDFMFLQVPLSSAAVDPGGAYRTRADLRVDETECTVVFDAPSGLSTITLPWVLLDGEEANLGVAIRTTGKYLRGRQMEIVSATGDTVVVRGDLSASQFYAGLLITSERTESTFYLRGDQGVTPTDRLTVHIFLVSYEKTGYTRLEANQGANRMKMAETKGIVLGTGDPLSSAPTLQAGTLEIQCDTLSEELVLRMVNDTMLPARWQVAEYRYQATIRAGNNRPGAQGG